ncbi:MAG: DUF349 domain-containing protein [Roseivirga sp.]|nr:DUF349 domain-containing protein [Roseivirga sp.]
MSEENKVPTGDQESKEANPDNNLNTEQANTQSDSPEEELSATASEPTEEPSNEGSEETPVVKESSTEVAEVAPVVEETASEVAEETPVVEEAPSEAEEATVETEQTTTEAEVPAVEEEKSEEEVKAPEPEQAPAEAAPAAEAEEQTEVSEPEEAPAEATHVEEVSAAEAEEVTTPQTENTPEAGEENKETVAPVEEPAVTTTEATSTEAGTTEQTTSAEVEVKSEDVLTTDAEATEAVEEEEEEIIDYSNHTREQLADVVEELSKQDNFKRADTILNQVLPLFKAVERASRIEAKERFIADGGEEDDFEFRHDEIFNKFDASVRLLRDRKASYYKERESRKESNYQHKLEVLDKLRDLIDGENATTNLAPIKALQEEWKAVGPVPNQHNRTLWANYNALLDRFYNNRHILFELKELDRKKNLVKKQDICEKAEQLDKLENIKDAIIQLNELHEEYKKIGPVPREVQEELWQRFKAASDAIYKKRKSYLDELKGELLENLGKKRALAEELKPFLSFDSDRINDWNAKTKEILAIQKKWDAMGGLPREHAKEVNKAFWSCFKGFFSNKNNFFKKLEGMRQENLEKKEALVVKAEALMENTDWDKTSEAMKALQRQWKEIGPVPEKFRNSVYAKFKEACDTFFNNRRSSQNKAEEQYVENLKHKEDMIREINERTEAGSGEAGDLDDLMVRWGAIGFVPRNSIKSIESKFKKAIDAFVASLDVDESAREALVMKAELNTLRKGPDADRRLNKKEFTLRKQINELEDNISLWNNNLAFFANSKTADKLKAEFDEKIIKAEEQIQHLKKQLKMVRSM